MRSIGPHPARPTATSQPNRPAPRHRLVRRLLPAALLAIASALMVAGPAAATPGDLDPSFGTGGIVEVSLGVDELAVQPDDGKLVAAGAVADATTGLSNLALARYRQDGSLDPTFGQGGTVIPTFAGHDRSLAGGLALQPDGKLVAAGVAFRTADVVSDFVLARFRPNGKLDRAFGTRGIVTMPFGNGLPGAAALAVQADGKLVVAGGAFNPATSNGDFGLARFNPNGTLDATFGSGGVVTTDFGGGIARSEAANSLVLQPDGKLVAAGTIGFFGRTATNIAVARYQPDGSLDPTFGTGGKLATAYLSDSHDNFVRALVLQPDGKLVVGGGTTTTTGRVDYALARFNPDGTPDATFGSGGTVTTAFGSDLASDQVDALALQPDGKLVASGRTAGGVLGLVRYNPDGSLDPSFGSGGVVLNQALSAGAPVVLQPDGKLVVSGIPALGQPSRPVLVRYLMS